MARQYRVWDNRLKRYVDDILVAQNGSLLRITVMHTVVEVTEPGRFRVEYETTMKDIHGNVMFENDVIWNTGRPVGQRENILIEFESIDGVDEVNTVGYVDRRPDILNKVEIRGTINEHMEWWESLRR